MDQFFCRIIMDEKRMEARWNQFAGRMKAYWGEVTHNPARIVDGDTQAVVGKWQECYHLTREEAQHRMRTIDRPS